VVLRSDHQRQARTSRDEPIDPGIARNLSELARSMQAEDDPAALLRLIVKAAVTEIDGADHAGISLVTKAGVRSEAASSELVPEIDEIQYAVDDGPCLRSLREQITVRSDDLHDEPRWPRFAHEAAERGVRSVLSVQLFVDGDNLGALNLYAEKPSSFTAADENVALLFASHAAVAMVDSRRIGHLRLALESRDVIGQAKGILMERFKIRAPQAFGMLVAVSQHTQRKLQVVAEELAATGELADIPE
jgi:GAF domain-containing protein